MRKEHDFLGTMNVPEDVYYGVQTKRAVKNFHITGERLAPDFIKALATVKKAAALANMETGRLNAIVGKALTRAADEIIDGQWLDQFPVDPIQGGAGTSINMNMNEVLCYRALEILGKPKGRYDIISPNIYANMAQSTNDVFPTGIKVCLAAKGKVLARTLRTLEIWLDEKADEFRNVLKMGRTHLQDAVPITLGQEMADYASAVRRARRRIETSLDDVHVVNMGGTAVGTVLNAEPEYCKLAAAKLSELTGEMFVTARNMVDSTNNTDVFADVSGSMKSAALVLIKMANDIRLMASGPRCGLHELNVPPRQPGSSIMPGNVNPVIAEVLDQTCYQVIGNDMAITLGVENGQFELNVMEPVMAFNLFHSMDYLTNAVQTFVDYLLKDLQANTDGCRHWVDRSVGVITALLPHIGYEEAAMLAKEAYSTGRPVRDIILAHGTLTKEQLDVILSPQEMTKPGIAGETFLHRQDGRKLASN